jgi:hypothetical protein
VCLHIAAKRARLDQTIQLHALSGKPLHEELLGRQAGSQALAPQIERTAILLGSAGQVSLQIRQLGKEFLKSDFQRPEARFILNDRLLSTAAFECLLTNLGGLWKMTGVGQ